MTDPMNELRQLAMRAGSTWTETELPRVAMVRAEACSDQVYEPMLHLVLQGSKSLSVGDQVLQLQAGEYFVMPVELPAQGQVRGGGRGLPYLAVRLRLDATIVAGVLADLGELDAAPPGPSFCVSTAGPDMLDAWLRLLRSIARPSEARLLAPMIEREILFRALQGPQGSVLRQLVRADGGLARVRRAFDWLRAHYAEPIRVEPLAAMAGMSLAAFYRHFRDLTAMSPIQYQKRLRLLTARRRLLFERGEAASIAFSVGYESASQFSREYARMFGLPPVRDVARFEAPAASAAPRAGLGR